MALKVSKRGLVPPFIVMDLLRAANERHAAGESRQVRGEERGLVHGNYFFGFRGISTVASFSAPTVESGGTMVKLEPLPSAAPFFCSIFTGLGDEGLALLGASSVTAGSNCGGSAGAGEPAGAGGGGRGGKPKRSGVKCA